MLGIFRPTKKGKKNKKSVCRIFFKILNYQVKQEENYYRNLERFQLCPIFIFEETCMANSMRFEIKHGLDFFRIGDLQNTKTEKVVEKHNRFSKISRVDNTSPQ